MNIKFSTKHEIKEHAMAVLHTAETGGAKALYHNAGGSSIERDIVGWDKLGRPLVLCGDRLHTADGAPFAHYKEFINVVMPDVPSIIRESIDRYLDNYDLGNIYDPVHDAVESELRRRRPVQTAPLAEGVREEHIGMPLLFNILELNAHMSPYGNRVTGTPLVNYLALDPFTGGVEEVRNVTVRQRTVAKNLVDSHRRGYPLTTAVALVSPKTGALKLEPLVDGEGYQAGAAVEALREAAATYSWWPTTAETAQEQP